MLEALKRDIINGSKPLAEAITLALPEFRDKISEHKIAYLVNEYQGYQTNALDYYKRPSKEYPPYRVVSGQLKLMKIADGELQDVTHPLATREQFFISAPVSWVEESVHLGIDPTMIEMAEMGKTASSIMVCIVPRIQIQRMLDIVKQSLLAFIDEADMV